MVGKRSARHCCSTAAFSRFSTTAFMLAPSPAAGHSHSVPVVVARSRPARRSRSRRRKALPADWQPVDGGWPPHPDNLAKEPVPRQPEVDPSLRPCPEKAVRSSLACLLADHDARSVLATDDQSTPANVPPGATVPAGLNPPTRLASSAVRRDNVPDRGSSAGGGSSVHDKPPAPLSATTQRNQHAPELPLPCPAATERSSGWCAPVRSAVHRPLEN